MCWVRNTYAFALFFALGIWPTRQIGKEGIDFFRPAGEMSVSYSKTRFKHEKKAPRPSMHKKTADLRAVVDSTIGRGTFGTVYRGHTPEGHDVAIKYLPVSLHRSRDAHDTLLCVVREMHCLRVLDHPHLLRRYECSSIMEDGADNIVGVHIVMPLYDMTLRTLIGEHRTQPSLTRFHIVHIIASILGGLAYMHAHLLLHRDVKPDNVLINRDGCATVIGDFGMVKVRHPPQAGSETDPMSYYVVTRWYRAPELLRGAVAYDGGIDVWATGCIFAEIVLGRTLFPGCNATHQLQLITEIDLEHPTSCTHACCTEPQLEEPARSFLRATLQMDPQVRATATALLAHPYLQPDPIATNGSPSVDQPTALSYVTSLDRLDHAKLVDEFYAEMNLSGYSS